MATRSIIRVAPLSRVFPSGATPEEAVFHANIARLVVLYEDLRIELASFQVDSIPQADWINKGDYRKRYFLRRSVGSVHEFSDAFGQLARNPRFKAVTRTFDAAAQTTWDEATAFFKKNAKLFRDVRNDLGGHFGTQAAKFAIESFKPGTIGTLEIVRNYSHEGVMYRPQFVGEVTARAFLRHLPGRDVEDKLHGLLGRIREAERLATRAVSNLIHFYLWNRFR